MKPIVCSRIFWIAVVSLVLGESASIMAANGDIQWFDINLMNEQGYETTVSKFFQEYYDTSADKCFNNTWWWCCWTSHLRKLPHVHTEACNDLTSSEIECADRWIEAHRYYCFSTNRTESATIHNTCHSWATGYPPHLTGPENQYVFQDDYTEIQEWQAYSGCLCQHSGNHTSVVDSVNPCGSVATIESKMGFYGVYITDTDIYSGIDKFWN